MELFSKLGIEWHLLVVQVVNFTILLVILRKFLYKPVLEILERRRAQVQESAETAERVKAEFAQFERQKEEQLAKAKAEARELVDAAAERIARMEMQAMEEAKAKSQAMLERARMVIGEEKGKIVEEAKREVAELVLAATEKVVGKEMKGKEAEEFIKRSL